jgi:hypothetical protein
LSTLTHFTFRSEAPSESSLTDTQRKEAVATNLNLLSLGKVIRALSKKESAELMYKESKLTLLLRDSLGGDHKTCMITTVSPCDSDVGNVTLRFAADARNIKNKFQAPKIYDRNSMGGASKDKDEKIALFESKVRSFKKEIQSLNDTLQAERNAWDVERQTHKSTLQSAMNGALALQPGSISVVAASPLAPTAMPEEIAPTNVVEGVAAGPTASVLVSKSHNTGLNSSVLTEETVSDSMPLFAGAVVNLSDCTTIEVAALKIQLAVMEIENRELREAEARRIAREDQDLLRASEAQTLEQMISNAVKVSLGAQIEELRSGQELLQAGQEEMKIQQDAITLKQNEIIEINDGWQDTLEDKLTSFQKTMRKSYPPYIKSEKGVKIKAELSGSHSAPTTARKPKRKRPTSDFDATFLQFAEGPVVKRAAVADDKVELVMSVLKKAPFNVYYKKGGSESHIYYLRWNESPLEGEKMAEYTKYDANVLVEGVDYAFNEDAICKAAFQMANERFPHGHKFVLKSKVYCLY